MLENKGVVAINSSWQRLLLILLLSLHISKALRCRSEDGPSEADMKRVIRSCMRRVGANVQNGGNGGGGGSGLAYQTISNSNFHYGQHGHNQQQHGSSSSSSNNQHGQQNNFKMEYGGFDGNGYDSDENDDADEYDSDYSDNMNGFHQARNTGSGRDVFQQRNHERNPILNNRNNGNSYGNGGGGNNHSGGSEGHSSSNRNSNGQGPRKSNTKSYNNNNSGGGGGGSGQGAGSGRGGPNGYGSGFGNARNFNNQNNENNRNNNGSSYDTKCIVHCFFDEMNMLDHNDYPDKQKVHYLLTKDMRNRDLRSFYAETIQSCYRYLESQRRKDKCQFSRDLIQCMAEYAKANCDDWEEFNVMFN